MSKFHLKNLAPLEEEIPVHDARVWRMKDADLKALQDEAYATPRGMLTGLLLGLVMWGALFAALYFMGWLF